MATQVHEADRAGPHMDLRLVDRKGRAHSWAIPKKSLPEPGEKILAIPQPTHTRDYAARKGSFEIPEGYGAGKVQGSGLKPVEVVRSQPGLLRFNVYGGQKEGNQEFAMVTTPKGQLLHNVTSTRESGVRGVGGHEIPDSKPKYREVTTDRVTFDDPNEIHQAKVDGAHVTFHLRGKKPVKAFSFRPTQRATGVLEHSHKLPNFRELRSPPGLAGTVLRGELYGVDKQTGRSIPAEQTGGLLNATVWRSRQKQKEMGVELRPAIFDVVRYQGRSMEDAPYEKKLSILREVEKSIPRLKIPPTAETPEEKVRLFSRIQSGEDPVTDEGIVSWRRDNPRPTKAKFRPDVDAIVTGITPGKGKHEGRVGALQVRLPGKSAVTNVGTGMSDKLREEISKNPDKYIGKAVQVRTMKVFPSGKLRSPSFGGFHIEKGKQDFDEKRAGVGSYVVKRTMEKPVQKYLLASGVARETEKGKRQHRERMRALATPYPVGWVALGMRPKTAGVGQLLGKVPQRVRTQGTRAGVGALVGAPVGAAVDDDSRVRGALVGAGAGALGGLGVGNLLERSALKRARKDFLRSYKDEMRPIVREIHREKKINDAESFKALVNLSAAKQRLRNWSKRLGEETGNVIRRKAFPLRLGRVMDEGVENIMRKSAGVGQILEQIPHRVRTQSVRAGVGALVGAPIGAAADDDSRVRGALVGAGVGALGGLGAGNLMERSALKKGRKILLRDYKNELWGLSGPGIPLSASKGIRDQYRKWGEESGELIRRKAFPLSPNPSMHEAGKNIFGKVAGVGVDVHGYRRDPDKPTKKWLKSWESDMGFSAKEDPEWAQGDFRQDMRLKTPFDRKSSQGYKMHLHVLQGLSAGPGDRKVIHKPSPFMDSLATDQAYRDKPQVVNLNRPQLRTLIKDYQSRRQAGVGEDAQDAFVGKVKSLLKNPKMRLARVEYE